MRAYDVVVVGKANLDYLVRGPRLPRPGQSANGDAFQEAPGGKGANQAVAAARLGARVALVARIGNDARGDAVVEALLTEGVSVDHMVRDPNASTGVALCQVGGDGEKQILSFAGANARLSADDVNAAADALRSTSVLLVSIGVPLEAVRQAVALGGSAGAQVVMDPSPPGDIPEDVFASLDIIRPNRSEARALTGVDPVDEGSAREALRHLLGRGARAACVQVGDRGDLLGWCGNAYEGGAGFAGDGRSPKGAAYGELWLPRFAVARIDATGAGDAFAAALAVCLAEGKALAEAGPFASAAAALATTVLGAQASLPRRGAVVDLLLSSHG